MLLSAFVLPAILGEKTAR